MNLLKWGHQRPSATGGPGRGGRLEVDEEEEDTSVDRVVAMAESIVSIPANPSCPTDPWIVILGLEPPSIGFQGEQESFVGVPLSGHGG